MKQLMTLLILCSLIWGCKKQQNAPAAPVPAPVQNNQAPPPPSLTAQEQQLVGLWIMDSCAMYSLANVRQLAYVYTSSLTCKMNFKTTGSVGGYNIDDGHNQCILVASIWSAPDMGEFRIGGVIYPITLLTSTRLTFIHGAGEWRYYLHK